ncbi:MAG: OsmC family protein [Planctomycetes bacterium]|nr:OsmC family protein [Planctomycetota bacterium]MCB9918488.1 OsmC family protein [Planctomycetota bacterium]
MVEIRTVYEGTLRTRAEHGPSGQVLVTDAPVDNHGKGESFSPTDLVATALGSCMVTILAIAAEARGLEVEGTRVRVLKEMGAVPRRHISCLRVDLELPSIDVEHRQVLENAARTCPVAVSLGTCVEQVVTFHWGAV